MEIETLYLPTTYRLTVTLPQYTILALFDQFPAISYDQHVKSATGMTREMFEEQVGPLVSEKPGKSLLLVRKGETTVFALNTEFATRKREKSFVRPCWRKTQTTAKSETHVAEGKMEENVRIERGPILQATIIKIIKVRSGATWSR